MPSLLYRRFPLESWLDLFDFPATITTEFYLILFGTAVDKLKGVATIRIPFAMVLIKNPLTTIISVLSHALTPYLLHHSQAVLLMPFIFASSKSFEDMVPNLFYFVSLFVREIITAIV